MLPLLIELKKELKPTYGSYFIQMMESDIHKKRISTLTADEEKEQLSNEIQAQLKNHFGPLIKFYPKITSKV